MKVTSLNIQAYQNISAINNQKKTVSSPIAKNNPNQKLHGAEFLDYLNKQEIKYLNNNFNTQENSSKRSNGEMTPNKFAKRIDILA